MSMMSYSPSSTPSAESCWELGFPASTYTALEEILVKLSLLISAELRPELCRYPFVWVHTIVGIQLLMALLFVNGLAEDGVLVDNIYRLFLLLLLSCHVYDFYFVSTVTR